MKKLIKKLQPTRYISLIVCIAFWVIGSKIYQNPLFFPTPMSVFKIIQEMFYNGTLWINLITTFNRVTIAICITGIISIPLGILIANYKIMDNIFSPLIGFLRYVPITALSPLLVLFLGIDETMKITFLVLATCLTYLPTVVQTCEEMDHDLMETAYTMGFNYNRAILHVMVPYVLPSLLRSLVTLYGVGWTFVILVEMTNTKFGLGHLMYVGAARGRTDTVFAAILIVLVVSFIFDKVMKFIIERVFRWRFGK